MWEGCVCVCELCHSVKCLFYRCLGFEPFENCKSRTGLWKTESTSLVMSWSLDSLIPASEHTDNRVEGWVGWGSCLLNTKPPIYFLAVTGLNKPGSDMCKCLQSKTGKQGDTPGVSPQTTVSQLIVPVLSGRTQARPGCLLKQNNHVYSVTGSATGQS